MRRQPPADSFTSAEVAALRSRIVLACAESIGNNASAERLKVGRLHGREFANRRQAMDQVIDSLAFYNHRRLHSMLG